MKVIALGSARFPHLKRRREGSVLVAALIILAVTFVAVSATMFEASNRFRTSHQSNRWSQAGQAAEAGAEIGLMTAQKGSWTTDGWSGTPGAVGAAAVTKTVTLSGGVANTGNIAATISVDKVSVSGSPWLRIRSTGTADLAAGKQSGIDSKDNLLRKVALQKNRYTGAALSAPQATRTVEVTARPNSPFTMGILLNGKVRMTGSATIDSFDSSDPTKSTGGVYDVTKRQSNGDIGINDTQGITNFGSNNVFGDLSYSGIVPSNMSNIKGTITTPFSKPLTPVKAPTWTTFSPTPTIIGGSTTLTGGTQASPTYYKVSALTLTGSNVLTLNPHAAGQQSYIEIWVTGTMKTTGSAYIAVKNGVHATIHVGGNIDISGSAVSNSNNIAENCLINVINPASTATTQTVTITGSGTMIAAINAPAADFTITGGANICGALIGNTLTTTGSAAVHYDEALANLNLSGGGYTFSGLAEAIR